MDALQPRLKLLSQYYAAQTVDEYHPHVVDLTENFACCACAANIHPPGVRMRAYVERQ